MENEIIDLTVSPASVYIDIDAQNASAPSVTLPDAGLENEKKKSRRKKRKRKLMEGDSVSSATQTREQSVEDGEIDAEATEERIPYETHNAEVRLTEKKPRLRERQEQIHRRRSVSLARQKTPPEKEKDIDALFFIDVQPTPMPQTAFFMPSHTHTQEMTNPPLLLPAHVSVFGTEPVEILPSTIPDPDEEDYIEYLDFDDRKHVVRYFEDPVEESDKKPNRTVCKNCGAEGEHKTAACPVLICLTCGARDEHSTRSCPISKTCFTCGMKGHINATCPNRKAFRMGDISKYNDCDRCGSHHHKTNECPTLWRLYEYLTEEAKDQTLRTRQNKRTLTLGQGGEGYIADDEWCYNCGSCGHWGDDCQDIPHQGDLPDESSAFSIHNTLSGPFFDSAAGPRPSTSRHREPRDWEQDKVLSSDWGQNLPDDVGRQGRRNNIAKMEKRAQEQVVDDDPDDWFGNPRNVRSRGAQRNSGDRAGAPKKITFGKAFQDSGKQFRPPAPTPSLLERLGDNYHHNDSRSKYHERPPDSRWSRKSDRSVGSQPRHSDRYGSERDHDRERDRHRHHRRDELGPRYKGGYSR